MEYRFRIIQDLHGAVFMDAGNVRLLRRRNGDPVAGWPVERAGWMKLQLEPVPDSVTIFFFPCN